MLNCKELVYVCSGPEEIRTPDLYSAIVALSQLSYRPGSERDRSPPEGCCQGSLAPLYLAKSTRFAPFVLLKSRLNSGKAMAHFTYGGTNMAEKYTITLEYCVP